MVVTACFGVFFYGQQLGANASVKRRAVFLAKEGIEAMRSIRNQTDTLPDEGSYGLTATEAIWQLTETPDVTNDLTRTITVETIDDYTKKITVDITWQHTGTDGSFFMISYLTPWTVTIDDIP